MAVCIPRVSFFEFFSKRTQSEPSLAGLASLVGATAVTVAAAPSLAAVPKACAFACRQGSERAMLGTMSPKNACQKDRPDTSIDLIRRFELRAGTRDTLALLPAEAAASA